jgi:hypothetical protein
MSHLALQSNEDLCYDSGVDYLFLYQSIACFTQCIILETFHLPLLSSLYPFTLWADTD